MTCRVKWHSQQAINCWIRFSYLEACRTNGFPVLSFVSKTRKAMQSTSLCMVSPHCSPIGPVPKNQYDWSDMTVWDGVSLNCNLMVFISKFDEGLINYSYLDVYRSLFQGNKGDWETDLKAVSGATLAIPHKSIFSLAGKRSGVDSRCGICIWKLLLWTHNMSNMKVKQTILGLKNRKNYRQITKMLGWAKSAI